MPVPLADIEQEFWVQLKFLNASCEAYDEGDRDEFRRIALAVRVLVYNNGQSKSLTDQLGLRGIPFPAYSRCVDHRNLLSEMPLVMIQMGPAGTIYLPCLDNGAAEPRMLSFEDWWGEEAFRSGGGVSMTRSGFVLHTANQAGGAHVDSEIDEEFYKIAKLNEAGWIAFSGPPENPSAQSPMEDMEKACVRHIGFEVLQALNPEWERIKGNHFCDCGSGRKHRYCHGKSN